MKHRGLAGLIVVSLVGIGSLFSTAASAADPIASCESIAAEYPDASIRKQIFIYRPPPKEISWGKQVAVGFTQLSGDAKVTDRSVTFSAANPERPISHPFTRFLTNGEPFPNIHFSKGDGLGRVTFAWIQDYSGRDYWGEYVYVPPCRYTQTYDVNPVRGNLPNFGVWTHPFGYQRESELLVADYFRFGLCDSRKDWLIAATGRITLVVRGFGEKGKISLPDPCVLGNEKTTKNRFWMASTNPDGFRIAPRTRKSGTGRMKFRINFQGRKLFAGTFRIRTKVIPVKEIPEGTDAFINVCINYGQTIYSRNGRLYCSVGGEIHRRIHKLRASTAWHPGSGLAQP